MTVQELIDELQKIEDKKREVVVYDCWTEDWMDVYEVDTYSETIKLR